MTMTHLRSNQTENAGFGTELREDDHPINRRCQGGKVSLEDLGGVATPLPPLW